MRIDLGKVDFSKRNINIENNEKYLTVFIETSERSDLISLPLEILSVLE